MTSATGGTQIDEEPGPSQVGQRGLPAVRIGIAGGLAAIMCCVGPTVLAIFGIVSAATAFTWATNLYDNYTWWFRIAGLLLMGLLLLVALRKRDSCSMAGVRSSRIKILLMLAVAIVTYVVLYVLTTWLGSIGT